MQNLFIVAVVWSAFLWLTSCTAQENNAPTGDALTAVFFPLADFIDSEIIRLDSMNVTMAKTIQYNDSQEAQTEQTVDFEQELAIFKRADINKPAWTDQYQADTLIQDKLVRETHYQALTPDMEVRSLLVKWNQQGNLTEIQIQRENSSALATNQYKLSYFPAQGYLIETHQENRTSDPIQILIEGNFEQ